MPACLVAFKFARDDTYSKRYDNFMVHCGAAQWWGETGSSIVVHADEPLDDFCRRILNPAVFDDRVDIAVVFDLDNRDGRAHGKFRNYGLFNVVPWIERAQIAHAVD